MKRSIQARVAIPVLFLAGILVPALVGLMTGDRDLSDAEHTANPFWLLVHVSDIEDVPYLSTAAAPVLLLAILVCLLQLLRVLRGLREVLAGPVELPPIESYDEPPGRQSPGGQSPGTSAPPAGGGSA